jgi:hypothetical protein
VFAGTTVSVYLQDMPFWFSRRFVTVTIAMLFSLSVAVHGFLITDMNAKMAATAAAMDMSSADSDLDDGKDDGGMKLACFALCSSNVAIISGSEPLTVVAALQQLGSPVLRSLSGRYGPPDPYPPKPFVLI